MLVHHCGTPLWYALFCASVSPLDVTSWTSSIVVTSPAMGQLAQAVNMVSMKFLIPDVLITF